MPPLKTGELKPDQEFEAAERLYRRVPPSCLSPTGELVPSHISCSFGNEIRKSPSVVRSKYGSAGDVLHSNCAGGNDVSTHFVFYLRVEELPKNVISGDVESFDFFPLHDPEINCYPHTVIACKKSHADGFSEPPKSVRNKLKALFVSAFQNQRIVEALDA